MKPVYGIVSDDFTGGLLVASYFEQAGLECPVYFDPITAVAEPPAAPIAVIAGRMRLAPVAEARSELTAALDALDALGCDCVAYKACATFDSTPEGNIGPAAEMLSARYDQKPLLISAGFPEFGTTVFQGHMFVRDTPVNESHKRFDPVTPMPDPNLARFLSLQTETPVGLIPHDVLIKGPAAAQLALTDRLAAGFRHVLLDTADKGDIDTSTTLVQQSRAFVASDPLVVSHGLARCAALTGTAPPTCHAEGPLAVLVGSVGPVAEAQLAAFAAQHPVHHIDLLDPDSTAAQIDAALTFAALHLGTRPFAITTQTDADGVAAAQAQLGRIGAARKAEHMLAEIARRLHAAGARRFIVVGGETSGAVVGALGITRMRSMPRGPLGGGFCVAEGPDPVSFFLKSGKLGVTDVLVRAIDAMRN
ncbi:four-carbon acid sugar kinase family protein [Paracoccus litorisediminis]|uniref:Four-carbon acid sugar kinase family protein n=1 Tax=Paracoccus litorisediminis TaxID=2006130 RepID=A0A844HYE7_9RHOB|nr:four-carbon acid sugar kinase family protein [Paracoccus litorisediminis]MTH62491.1 four-carbon acid sugar kinase family protein [Paracoccus litorisediminis]